MGDARLQVRSIPSVGKLPFFMLRDHAKLFAFIDILARPAKLLRNRPYNLMNGPGSKELREYFQLWCNRI